MKTEVNSSSNKSETVPVNIPFSKSHLTGKEVDYICRAISSGNTAGNGNFTKQCQDWLTSYLGSKKVLLTHSCTAALEMAVILADVQPGDEVIMPSFTFVSTANAVVLRGGIPVFVDIRPDTLNLDETKIEAAITSKTRAIMVVHYAGVGCEMEAILSIAKAHNFLAIEDSAQGFSASYKDQHLGSLGDMATFSFHATKNVVSGEGGALIINNPDFLDRAEIIWEKGTNRSKFLQGQVDKYTWLDIGSSYLPSDLIAAFLLAQLEDSKAITARRLTIWNQYHNAFAELEAQAKVLRPSIPKECQHNAHIYHLMLDSLETRTKVLDNLKQNGVQATFHYVPLHSAPAGQKYGRTVGDMGITDDISSRILRLPLSASLTQEDVEYVIYLILKNLAS